MEESVKQCTYCSRKFSNFRDHQKHYLHWHAGRPDLIIPCGVIGCSETFKKFPSLRSHLSRKHPHLLKYKEDTWSSSLDGDDTSNDDDDEYENPIEENINFAEGDLEDCHENDHVPEIENRVEANEKFTQGIEVDKLVIARFILQIRAQINNPEDLVAGFLKTTKEVVAARIEITLQRVSKVLLDSAGLNLKDYFNVEEEINSIDFTANLDTILKQNCGSVSDMKVVGVDCRGVKRGACNNCDCEYFEYDDKIGANCAYCQCGPTKHVKIAPSDNAAQPNQNNTNIIIDDVDRILGLAQPNVLTPEKFDDFLNVTVKTENIDNEMPGPSSAPNNLIPTNALYEQGNEQCTNSKGTKRKRRLSPGDPTDSQGFDLMNAEFIFESNESDKSSDLGQVINISDTSSNNEQIADTFVHSDEQNTYVVINPSKDTNCTTTSKRQKRPVESRPNKHLASWATTEFLKTLDLRQYLRNFSISSESAVSNYEHSGMLTESDRSHVCDAVADVILRKNFVPGRTEYTIAAKKICEVFPCESEEVYYNPPDKTHRNAFGKLPHKIKNIKYQLAKQGINTFQNQLCTKKFPSTLDTEARLKYIEPAILEGSTDINDEAVQSAISYLKQQNLNFCPELLQNWSVTHALRSEGLKNSRDKAKIVFESTINKSEEENVNGDDNSKEQHYVHDYFKEWTILGRENGFTLLDQDFKELFPGKQDSLLAQWETRKQFIINLVTKEVAKTDLYSIQLLKDYDKAAEGKRDAIIIHLLPSLLSKRLRSKDPSVTTTLLESRLLFILHVTEPEDLQRSVEQHAQKLRSLGLTLELFMIIVGPSLTDISASYLQIDNVRYSLKSPITALDICFKSHFALNAAYLTPCKTIFHFIQQYFFDIHLEEDEKIQRVTAVISSLKGMELKKK